MTRLKENHYHIFAGGSLLSEKMLEGTIKANNDDLKKKFSEKTDEIEKLIKIYKDKVQQIEEITNMNKMFQKDLSELSKKVHFGMNINNINNRMASWYEEQNFTLEKITWYFSKIYWI